MKKCTREGIAWLVAADAYQTVTTMRTSCKTKGCPVCRHKVKAKFTMLVEYGLSILDPCYFITLTLRAGFKLEKDASYVRPAWAAMLVWFRTTFPKVEFVKVVELTRQSQPHLHLVMHLGEKFLTAACEQNHRYNDRWRNKRCDCLEHQLSAAWSRITGDSYVVNVSKINNPRKTAGYIGKYMAKGIHHKRQLERLGFKRAWARSRGWPFDQIRLAQTEEGGWKKKYFTGPKQVPETFIGHGSVEFWLQASEDRGIKRVGTDLAIALQQGREAKAERFIPPEILRRVFHDPRRTNSGSAGGRD